jgi:hypothetical protein
MSPNHPAVSGWADWPSQFNVRCPQCGRRATFNEPFQFFRGPDAPEGAHIWESWRVIEKYPSLIGWHPPEDNLYQMHRKGVVQCPFCHLVKVCEIEWPRDAYYRWDVRGFILWAMDENHARALLDFIGGVERDPSRYPAYTPLMKKLPRKVVSAKARDSIVKQIAATLAKQGQ